MQQTRRDFSAYSPLQLKILKWIFVPSAILSAISSICLLRQILFAADAPHRKRKTYHRVLLGISVMDIISSTAVAVFASLIYGPNLEPGLSCTMDAAFQVFGGGAPIYMACLSVYFLLVIRYSVPDKTIQDRYEIWFHLISLLYPLFIVAWALIDRAFNPVEYDVSCYIQEYPIGCLELDDVPCQRGGYASLLGLIGGILPFFAILFVLCFSNVLIYWTVRKTEARARRYDFPGEAIMRSSSHNNNNNQEEEVSSSGLRQSKSKTKQVAAQSFLFVLGFFLTYLSGVVLYLITAFDPNGTRAANYFPLQIMVGITWPLQGFFDFLIYVRPRYLQCRRCKSEWGRGRCFLMVAFSLEDFRNTNNNNGNNNNQRIGRTKSYARCNHNDDDDDDDDNDPKIASISSVKDLEMPSCILAEEERQGDKSSASIIPQDDIAWEDEL